MSTCLFSFGVGVSEDRAMPFDPFLRTLPGRRRAAAHGPGAQRGALVLPRPGAARAARRVPHGGDRDAHPGAGRDRDGARGGGAVPAARAGDRVPAELEGRDRRRAGDAVPARVRRRAVHAAGGVPGLAGRVQQAPAVARGPRPGGPGGDRLPRVQPTRCWCSWPGRPCSPRWRSRRTAATRAAASTEVAGSGAPDARSGRVLTRTGAGAGSCRRPAPRTGPSRRPRSSG